MNKVKMMEGWRVSVYTIDGEQYIDREFAQNGFMSEQERFISFADKDCFISIPTHRIKDIVLSPVKEEENKDEQDNSTAG